MKSSALKSHTLHLNFADGDVSSLHPHQLQIDVRGRALSKLLFEGLTRINQKGDPELTGADSVHLSPDGTHYTFLLNEQKWSDGTDVSAHHYERAWKEALSPTSNCAWSHLLYVIKGAKEAKLGKLSLEEVGVKALNEKTLDIQLICPVPYFLELLAQPVFMPLKHQQEPTCFNGPFIIDKWEKECCLFLKANPNFWNREAISFKRIEISMVKDARTAFTMYEKGDIDWIGRPLSSMTNEDLEYLMQKQQLQSHQSNRPFWIFFNTEKSPFTSGVIRQALSLAFNRNAVKSILIGDSPLYTPLPKTLSLSRRFFDFDTDHANQLFEKGLKELQCDRMTFPPIVLSYFNIPSHKRLAEFLKESWENTFSIKVQLIGLEWNTFFNNLIKGNFHIGGCVVSSLISDPIELLERFEYKSIHNFSNWDFPPYKEKILQARGLMQPKARKQLLREAEEILIEEVPFFPVADSNHAYSATADLKGFVFDNAGSVDMAYAYFER